MCTVLWSSTKAFVIWILYILINQSSEKINVKAKHFFVLDSNNSLESISILWKLDFEQSGTCYR